MVERERPTGASTADVGGGPAIDVPLTDAGHGQAAVPDGSAPDTPNWRRTVAIALVGGTVIGIGTAIVVLDTDDAVPTVTVPAEEQAAVITTPPTLTPLSTLPPPDFGARTTATAATTARPQVVRPVYDDVEGSEPADLVHFDFAGAVDRLDDDAPRRSETRVELGHAGFVLDVTIERDPVRDRYRISVDSAGGEFVAIVDVASGTTYLDSATDGRADVLNADIIAGSTAADVNEYFDRLLLGPVRSDTYDAASTRGRGLVAIDGVGEAREFVTNIRGDLIPEWQLYAFGPTFEFPVDDRPSLLEYAVYVTEDGDVAHVDGVALVGVVHQLVRHRVIALDESPVIELFDPLDVTGRPVVDGTRSTEP